MILFHGLTTDFPAVFVERELETKLIKILLSSIGKMNYLRMRVPAFRIKFVICDSLIDLKQ